MSKPLESYNGQLAAPFVLSTEQGEISPRRLQLLQAIASSGSINAAARLVGMTYKGAWDALEIMNNLAGSPLVTRQQGGKGGGGALLTPAGQKLLDDLSALQALQKDFMARVQASGDLDESLALFRRITMRTSARNVLHGTVENIQHSAVTTGVQLRLAGGDSLYATITRESAEDLGLEIGSQAQALIKASWILLSPAAECGRTSARNRLCGTVLRIVPGELNVEVVLQLQGGNTLAATITREAQDELAFNIGDSCCALIKSSHIILGVES
ncbi:MAG: TOBE domain-containing protein [Gammaproteobacteria bacterium]|nr:TOBE domain-containing protein [Gammaproteobacteria bacterium]MDP2141662.1 TOBE domain-containing protein [Gammaproteobacteria bacterium]MDP2347897.1 TOBE domain-containing protein [Gammaproteobacteria bacterium]